MANSLTNFEILNRLGDGAFSTVFRVRRKSDGLVYALKKVRISSLKAKERENALNEVRILASVTHPNIVQYKEAFIDHQSNTLCIVMEYCDDGDLLGKIRQHERAKTNFPEAQLWRIFGQILQAMKALHDANILHRDLKCANVFLFKDGTVKLGDMNVSKVVKGGLVYTQTGTPYYASPEVWKDRPYNMKSDIWSLGVVMYEAAALRPPFMAPDMQGLYKKVIRGVYPSISSNYSGDMATMIRNLLQVNAQTRPNCGQVLNIPAVARNLPEDVRDVEDPSMTGRTNCELLGTIKMPRNIRHLAKALPQPKYGESLCHDTAASNRSVEYGPNKENIFPRVVRSNSRPVPVRRRNSSLKGDSVQSRVNSMLRQLN